jgi:hypothetical protein
MKQERMSDKYLVLGSAPYMRDWVATHLDWFVTHGYQVVTFNNSWNLLLINDRSNITCPTITRLPGPSSWTTTPGNGWDRGSCGT